MPLSTWPPGHPTRAPGPAWLFCPGDRPDRFGKAAAEADIVILDLEDAVAPQRKPAAREHVQARLSEMGQTNCVVRVNSVSSPDFHEDLAALGDFDDLILVLAKSDSARDVERLAPHPVIALCETTEGVLASREIARADNCAGIMLGTADLIADLGIAGGGPTRGLEVIVSHARSAIVLAAAAAGLASIDTAYLSLADMAGLTREATTASEMGMTAKTCIHPSQVAAIRSAFLPRPEDVKWAHAVIAHAEADGSGASLLNGQMIDSPVITRARSVLGKAGTAINRCE